MRKYIPWLIVGLSLSTLSCLNEQERFCSIAAKTTCEKCHSCGPDGFVNCGLMQAKTVDACEKMIYRVCRSNDGVYNAELGRTCLEHINRVQCGQMRAKGKPDVCNRLF